MRDRFPLNQSNWHITFCGKNNLEKRPGSGESKHLRIRILNAQRAELLV